jgi:hypothetical protein
LGADEQHFGHRNNPAIETIFDNSRDKLLRQVGDDERYGFVLIRTPCAVGIKRHQKAI